MNENLNLIEIFKDVPAGVKLWSPIFGEVVFERVIQSRRPELSCIKTLCGFGRPHEHAVFFYADGRCNDEVGHPCMVFPSETQRDWSKFKIDKC